MKRIILAAVLAVGLSTAASARDFSFGAKVGLNLSGLSAVSNSAAGRSSDMFEGNGVKAGFLVGVVGNYSFNRWLGVQPEVLFSMQGGRQKADGTLSLVANGAKLSTTLSYIDIPLLLDIKPFRHLSILVGPKFGFNVAKSSELKSGSTTKDLSDGDFDAMFGSDALRRFDFSLAAGAEYTLLRHLVVGVRYNFGITPALSSDGSSVDVKGWRNHVFQVSAGWKF